MTTAVRDTSPSAPRHQRRRWVKGACIAALLLVVAAVGAGLTWYSHIRPTPYSAVDAYTAAAATGDREALEAIVGDHPKSASLLDRHAGQPMTATTVTMEMGVSPFAWGVEIRYESFGQEPYSERVIAVPRSGSPDRLTDFVIVPGT